MSKSFVKQLNDAANGQGMKVKAKKLTRKQQAFVDYIKENPKSSGVEAAMAVYGKPDKQMTYTTAGSIAVENLQKPAIMQELENYGMQAKNNLLEIENYARDMGQTFSKEGASYAKVAADINESILDRVLGKAKQVTEVQSTGVQLHIDLTTALAVQADQE